MARIRMLQYVAAGTVCVITVALALGSLAMFRSETVPADASVWRILLADPTARGFARLGVTAAGIYVVVSVPALIVAGRWLRSAGPSGITVDTIDRTEEVMRLTRAEVEETFRRIENRLALQEELLDG